MTKKWHRLLGVIGICLWVGLPLQADFSAKDKEQIIKQIFRYMYSWHYSPARLNDAFSKRIFDLYIKRLDPQKHFFLKQDIQHLKRYETEIDNDLRRYSLQFVDTAVTVYEKRVKEVQKFYPDLINEPYDFSQDESIELDSKKRDYAQNMEELKEDWRSFIKYQILTTYVALLEEEKVKDRDLFHPELEKKAKERVKTNLERTLSQALKSDPDEDAALFLEALANSYDPHTDYFLPERREDFDISLTGKLEGIGAMLKDENGNVKVLSVVPGSAAWRQKQLQPGDMILKVGQADEEPVMISGMRVQDAVKLIRGKKGTEVRLTVKKPDGQIVVIPLIRDVVVLEDSYAKGAVIQNKATQKWYGYIYLPSFYRDFNSDEARNSTDDIKKILGQLKQYPIQGMILDLRNNGGGALRDAVYIGGLFLEQGPIVQIETQLNSREVLFDPDPSVQYEGPIVVLVNRFSASASEILAGALQDYQRAVIIGGSDSFGKGTVQTFVDLDKTAGSLGNTTPIGSVKLTIQKFFRVTGQSTQYKGVKPDILLPDMLGAVDAGESSLEYSLPWTEVSPVPFQKWQNPPPLKELKQRSEHRVATNPTVAELVQYAQKLGKQARDTQQTLAIQKALSDQKQTQADTKRVEALQKGLNKVEVSSLQSLKTQEEKDRQEELAKQIRSDFMIEEAVWVLNDLTESER